MSRPADPPLFPGRVLTFSRGGPSPALEAAMEAGVAYTSEILIGNAAEKIVKRAEELGCDGIVIGTQGRGAIGSLLMGSVAMKVVHLTTLPVTLVK